VIIDAFDVAPLKLPGGQVTMKTPDAAAIRAWSERTMALS